MAFRLITANERLAAAHNKDTFAILGQYGVGKTSLLHTLPEADTLALDFEAGMKSVQTWGGDCIELRAFADVLDVACLIGGPKAGIRESDFFSDGHHRHVSDLYAGLDLKKYRRIFFDSITEVTHVGWDWARMQPGAISERSGKDDPRGTYGELGRSVISVLKHMQHAPGIDIIFVARLERITDEFNREIWQPQMMGGMTARELPGIVDHVITMSQFDHAESGGWQHQPNKGEHRAFVCHKINPWGLPAKTRSDRLGLIEEPHLGRLIEKINLPARPAADRLQFGLPDTGASASAAEEKPEPTSSKKGK